MNAVHKGQRTDRLTVGDLAIDFEVLAGDIDTSAFARKQIAVGWLNDAFRPAERVTHVIPERWQLLCDQAKQRGQYLVDNPLARLVRCEVTADTIHLTLQPTTYGMFAATNLSLDLPLDPSGDVCLRQLLGSPPVFLGSPYMANPLNVIAMIVTSDQWTFAPRRTDTVYESPRALQASVGGAVEPNEHPMDALIREIQEEWGLAVDEKEIVFLALGLNLNTGEPDLIALVESPLNIRQVSSAFDERAERKEFAQVNAVELTETNLPSLVLRLCSDAWSSPSDQAAFLLTLVRKLRRQPVEFALREAGQATVPSDGPMESGLGDPRVSP